MQVREFISFVHTPIQYKPNFAGSVTTKDKDVRNLNDGTLDLSDCEQPELKLMVRNQSGCTFALDDLLSCGQ